MQNGKSTDKDQLASGLDTLSLRASSSFNKEKAWDKLYSRMHGPKATSRKHIYGWAAAAVLILTATLYTILQKVQPTANGINGLVRNFAIEKNPVTVPENNYARTESISGKTVYPTIATTEKKFITSNHIPQNEPDTQLAINTGDLREPQSVIHIHAETEAPIIVPKKKLAVVYNNEVTVAAPEDQSPGNPTPGNIPGFRKTYTEPMQTEGTGEKDPEFNRRKWFLFNKSPKPKE